MTDKTPFDPEDTDWGRQVNENGKSVDRRLMLLEEEIHRIPLIEAKLKGLDVNLGTFGTKLIENTNQTNAIKADTEWLVNVFKGFKAAGPVIGWFILAGAGLVTMIGGLIYMITGHGKPPG